MIPDGYHAEERSRSGLAVGGSILFGISYAMSFGFGILLADFQGDASGNQDGVLDPGWFFAPVIGPFGAMMDTGKVDSLLLVDGLAQATGVAMMICGLTSTKTVLVPNTSAQVMLTPARVGSHGHGLAWVGTF